MQALNGMLAIRSTTLKAIFGTGSGGFTQLAGRPCFAPDTAGQLYDLADDPGEQCNRWDRRPGQADQLLGAFVSATGFDPVRHGPSGVVPPAMPSADQET